MQKQRVIFLSGAKVLKPTPVFDTYWKFAKERQDLFMRRVNGEPQPWTQDQIIANHRFTNAYRASDRVSQYLIKNVIYTGDQSEKEIFFRVLLFKIFNKIETWETLQKKLGKISTKNFDHDPHKPGEYEKILDSLIDNGKRIYSAAYIMPSPKAGYTRKHANHLALMRWMLADKIYEKISLAKSLEEVYKLLLSQPSFGPFLAFQFAIDLNYSNIVNFSEMDFVVAGPGAINGIKKCFYDTDDLSEADVIKAVADMAEVEFERLELDFKDLWGRRLQLIDCQNIFCETDKYARVAHPEFKGKTNRLKIKQKYKLNNKPLSQFYPPKWNVNLPKELKNDNA